MSSRFTLAKYANKWGTNGLDYFKIHMVEMTVENFLPFSTLPVILPDLYNYVKTELDDRERVEDDTLCSRLYELHNADHSLYSETAVGIFTFRFLEIIQFTNRPVLMKMNLPLDLHFAGEIRFGNPHLAAVDNAYLVSGFYQENKTNKSGDKDKDMFCSNCQGRHRCIPTQ